MEHQPNILSVPTIRAKIVSLLTNCQPLSEPDIDHAKQLIKEVRVQSPAQGLDCQDKLTSRIADDSIKTEGFYPPRAYLNIVRSPSRTPSPLVTSGPN